MALLYPRAARCIGYLISKTTTDGLRTQDTGCGEVVDWGYMPPPATTAGGVDITLNCFYLSALTAMSEWCSILGHDSALYEKTKGTVTQALVKRLGLPRPPPLPQQRRQQQQECEEKDGAAAHDGWVVVEQLQEEAQPPPPPPPQALEQENVSGAIPTVVHHSKNNDEDNTAAAAAAAAVSEIVTLDWSTIGYHAAAMALSVGLLGPPAASPSMVRFQINPSAKRL